MSKAIIHQFDPQIYPRLLWVVIGETKGADISDRFDVPDMDDCADARVDIAGDKITGKGGILVRFRSRKAATIGTIAHESVHAAMEIFRYVDAECDTENQEPFAYLVGWIAGCIKEAMKPVSTGSSLPVKS